MRREDRGGVADTLLDLSLGEIPDVPQACSTKVRVRENGAGKIRTIKDCAAQICGLEIGTVQARISEVSPGHICIFKFGPRQGGGPQKSPPHTCRAQIYRTSIDRAHLALAQT